MEKFLLSFQQFSIKLLLIYQNWKIFELLKVYSQYNVKSDLLKGEIPAEDYTKLTTLADSIDYTSLDSVITKIDGDDETLWGLTEQEIKDVKLLFDISEYASSVDTQILLKLLMAGKTLGVDAFKTKVMNLYNNLP